MEAELCLLWVHAPVWGVRSGGALLEGLPYTLLGIKDIWDSQGGVGGSSRGFCVPGTPSPQFLYLRPPPQSGEARCPSLPTPCGSPKVRPDPQASHKTKQWFLWREGAAPVALHTVCGAMFEGCFTGPLSPSWVSPRPLLA